MRTRSDEPSLAGQSTEEEKMTAIEEPVAIDGAKLEEFVFRAVDEVGATLNAALVVMGDKLGLYRELAGAGPLTSAQLAERTGTAERYVREWLNAQAAGGARRREGAAGTPEEGAGVADLGCGHGSPTILMAKGYPSSRCVGSDYHEGSIATARERAEQAGVADRVRFEVAPAASYSGEGYDLVTMFDCLHDMGDPAGAARHVRGTLAPDGTWMIVEPMAGDRVEDNLNPVGRAYYGFSTLLCTPASLSQEVGLALGAQAGEARIRDVVTSGGFTRLRRAA